MNNRLLHLVSFFAGVLTCYFTLQYQYFEIKRELDVPGLIVSLITLIIGWYIADTLQRKVNRNQNQQTYLVNKLDILWHNFNTFSEKLYFDLRISASDIGILNKTVIFHVSYIKNLFSSFGLDDTSVCELERNLEDLESFLANLPANNNTVDFSSQIHDVKNKVLLVNQGFSKTLEAIQGL